MAHALLRTVAIGHPQGELVVEIRALQVIGTIGHPQDELTVAIDHLQDEPTAVVHAPHTAKAGHIQGVQAPVVAIHVLPRTERIGHLQDEQQPTAVILVLRSAMTGYLQGIQLTHEPQHIPMTPAHTERTMWCRPLQFMSLAQNVSDAAEVFPSAPLRELLHS